MQPVFRIVETISSVSRAVEQSTARLTNARFALLEHLALLAELHDGAFYVFYDRGQTIISRRVEGHTVQTAPQWIDAHMDCRLVLYRNCRNTAEIGRTVRSFLTGRQRNYLNEIHGKRPCAVFAPDIHALDTAAADFVQRMRSEEKLAIEDMVILTVSTLEKSAFSGLNELGGIPVSNQPETGKLWFTTVRRYKGLEAKAVLLVDVRVSALTNPTCQRLIYVGSSRATAYLETLFLNDVPHEEYAALTAQLGVDIASSPQGIASWLGMECRADG